MRIFAAIATASLLACAAVDARADDPPGHDWRSEGDAARKTETPKSWYGYQLLAVDVPFDVLYFVGANTSSSASGFLSALGVFVPLFVGPVAHGVHQRPVGVIVGSVLLRLVIPIVSGFAGTSATTQPPCPSNPDGDFAICVFPTFAGFANGYGVGMLVAQAIDDGLVAWESAPNAPVASPTARSAFTWSPKVASARGEGGRTVTTFGIGGTF